MRSQILTNLQPWLLLTWVFLLSFFFAKVEIHIEGSDGWAAKLPTWRIEKHWLLDIFWGSRPMTGYHAWVFSFIALFFHITFFVYGSWTLQLEARILASLIFFWIFEDFLWFVLNPAFGIGKFRPEHIPWHKRWLLGMPIEYVSFACIGSVLFYYSF